MFHTNKPRTEDLPTSQELLSSTKKAFVVALTILFIAVLPAEYGIDITGIGGLIGLKKMGEIKQSLAAESEKTETTTTSSSTPVVPTNSSGAVNSTESINAGANPTVVPASGTASLSVLLKPNQSAELKVNMKQGQKISYTWEVDGGVVNYNVHGESAVGQQTYEYADGLRENSFEGKIEAKFDGSHGWFFRSREKNDVVITLQVNGEFGNLRQVE